MLFSDFWLNGIPMTISLVQFIDQDKAIHSVRHTVFTLEQGVDTAIDFDGDDVHAIHALVTLDDRAVGTGRMLPDGHIGRVAVLQEFREQGIGKAILDSLIQYGRDKAFPSVYLYAQETAVAFYEKLGFTVNGESFMEAGILHTPMSLSLTDTD